MQMYSKQDVIDDTIGEKRKDKMMILYKIIMKNVKSAE